jgi:hypothetical protein
MQPEMRFLYYRLIDNISKWRWEVRDHEAVKAYKYVYWKLYKQYKNIEIDKFNPIQQILVNWIRETTKRL